MAANKTRKKNERKRIRGERNLFWLVMSTCGNEPLLFSKRPYRETSFIDERILKYFKEPFEWDSPHGMCVPRNGVLDRLHFDHTLPVKVNLVLCDVVDDNPDLFMQRYKDCLFVSRYVERVFPGGDESKVIVRVPHKNRLPGKLFPEVTEESGVVGIRILRGS